MRESQRERDREGGRGERENDRESMKWARKLKRGCTKIVVTKRKQYKRHGRNYLSPLRPSPPSKKLCSQISSEFLSLALLCPNIHPLRGLPSYTSPPHTPCVLYLCWRVLSTQLCVCVLVCVDQLRETHTHRK